MNCIAFYFMKCENKNGKLKLDKKSSSQEAWKLILALFSTHHFWLH